MNELIQLNPTLEILFDEAKSKRLLALAQTMARGEITVPKHLQNRTADCLAVIIQATTWGMNPFGVAQATFVGPDGKLGYEAKLINAVLASLRAIDSPLEHEQIGDWDKILSIPPRTAAGKSGKTRYIPGYTREQERGLGVMVTGRINHKPYIHRLMLTNCYPRFSSQWATNPWMQICYAADRQWARMFVPWAMLGVYTDDELQPQEKDVTPQGPEVERINVEVTAGVKTPEATAAIAPKLDLIKAYPVQPRPEPEDEEIEIERGAPEDNETPAAFTSKVDSDTRELHGPVDSQGTTFNPELHAVGKDGEPSRRKDGTWRKRRAVVNAEKPLEKIPETSTENTQKSRRGIIPGTFNPTSHENAETSESPLEPDRSEKMSAIIDRLRKTTNQAEIDKLKAEVATGTFPEDFQSKFTGFCQIQEQRITLAIKQ